MWVVVKTSVVSVWYLDILKAICADSFVVLLLYPLVVGSTASSCYSCSRWYETRGSNNAPAPGAYLLLFSKGRTFMPSSYWRHIYSVISLIKFTDWLKVNAVSVWINQQKQWIFFTHMQDISLICLPRAINKTYPHPHPPVGHGKIRPWRMSNTKQSSPLESQLRAAWSLACPRIFC